MPTLWHYTTQTALTRILQSKALYASDVQYMNDHMELKYAMALLPGALDGLPEFQDFNSNPHGRAVALDMLKRSLAYVDFTLGTYAVSLSGEADSLSQWRAYSGDATGYALGFDQDLLASATPSTRWPVSLGQCSYKPDEQLERLRVALHAFLKTETWTIYLKRNAVGPGFPNQFKLHFMQAAPWLKDPAFATEFEWRLVSERAKFDADTTFGVREGRQFLVPYLSLPLENLPNLGLREVLVGPNAHPENAEAATKLLLAHHRISQQVEIVRSRVPYRRV